MYGKVAQKIFDEMSSEFRPQLSGHITLSYDSVIYQVKEPSAFGDLFGEYIRYWLEEKNIYNRPNPETQTFPDYYLNPNSEKKDLLEVKTFKSARTPAFDLGRFQAYINDLYHNPLKVNCDYIIFSYQIFKNGAFKIEDIWLKKIWEICGPSADSPVKFQMKSGGAYALRPVSFTSTNSQYMPFTSLNEFLKALEKTIHNVGTAGKSKIALDKLDFEFRKEDWLNHVISGIQ